MAGQASLPPGVSLGWGRRQDPGTKLRPGSVHTVGTGEQGSPVGQDTPKIPGREIRAAAPTHRAKNSPVLGGVGIPHGKPGPLPLLPLRHGWPSRG